MANGNVDVNVNLKFIQNIVIKPLEVMHCECEQTKNRKKFLLIMQNTVTVSNHNVS